MSKQILEITQHRIPKLPKNFKKRKEQKKIFIDKNQFVRLS